MLLFGDLHCSQKTLSICLDVLKDIHSKALRRQETVGMLGDFFDTVYRRGTIPVDMLNTLLDFFATEWKVPIVFIPGNHDYIDANETEHALDPFRYASDYITVLDEPTVLDRVLWVPWKRNNDTLKQTFKLFEGQYDFIFGHFDVIGASVNSNTVSDRGLHDKDFPKPAISGHYHRSQQYGQVTYIGSPYQTSMSEAGQTKRIISFQHEMPYTSIIVHYGPKRFKVTEDPESWPYKTPGAGDIVYMDTFTPEKMSEEANQWVHRLKEHGVNVVLQRFLRKESVCTSLLGHEQQLSPMEMFKKYATNIKITTHSAYPLAMDILHSVSKTEHTSVPQTLKFCNITFQGFGPFVNSQIIHLQNRGLTKITGVWKDGAVGSSNGAGKSMASVSAFLWCLTGYSDMRTSTMLKHTQANAACINLKTREAYVKIEGLLGNKHFYVSRTVSIKQKTNFLEFYVDGKRLTRSTQAGTQQAINELLFRIPKGKGLPKAPKHRLRTWLMRTLVWEQAGAQNSWLEENDNNTKEYLLLLCNMNVWEDMLDIVTEQHTKADSQYHEYKTLYSNALTKKTETLNQLERVENMMSEWIIANNKKIKSYRTELNTYIKYIEQLGDEPAVIEKPFNKNKRKHDEITQTFGARKHDLESKERKAAKFYDIRDKTKYLMDIQEKPYDAPPPPEQNLRSAIEEMGIRKQQFRMFKSAFEKPTKCPTCKQTIAVCTVEKHDLEKSNTEYLSSKKLVREQEEKVSGHKKQVREEETRQIRIGAWRAMEQAKKQLDIIQEEYSTITNEKRAFLDEEIRWNDEVMAHGKWIAKRNEIISCMRMLEKNIQSLLNEGNPFTQQLSDLQLMVTDNASAADKYHRCLNQAEEKKKHLSSVKLWCGTKGIQTYVVESLLFKIAKYTTDWCKKLFDEASLGTPTFTMKIGEKEVLEKSLQFGESTEAKALSGGQYRRLQIAAFLAWRTLAESYTGIHTNLLMLDEAGSNVDIVGFRQMEQALKDWSLHKTCMFISHDTEADKGSMIYDTHIQINASVDGSVVIDYEKSI